MEIRQTMKDQEYRAKVFRAKGKLDYEIEHFMFDFSFNTCKWFKGVDSNIVARIMAKDVFRALSSTMSCLLNWLTCWLPMRMLPQLRMNCD